MGEPRHAVSFTDPAQPFVKGERPGEARAATIERRVILTADEPWPAYLRRGVTFAAGWWTSNEHPRGGRNAIDGKVIGRSRDGRTLTVVTERWEPPKPESPALVVLDGGKR